VVKCHFFCIIQVTKQKIIHCQEVALMKKNTYRVKNWAQYNRSFVNRGNLTIWFDEDSVVSWASQHRSGRRGRDQTYSDRH